MILTTYSLWMNPTFLAPHQPEAEEIDDLEEDSPEEVSTLMQDSDAYSESEDDPDL